MRWSLLIVCAMAWGQEFEVASIQRATPPDATTRALGCGTTSPGRYVCTKAQVSQMVYAAFAITANGLKFTPDSDRFDIQAKIPEGATGEDIRKMMQYLLLTRFKLKFHHEMIAREFYELKVAPGGLKMRESTGEPSAPAASGGKDADGFPIAPPRVGALASLRAGGLMRLAGTQVPMPSLTNSLMRVGPVVDITGLRGLYDINLTFTRESVGEEVSAAEQSPGLTVFQALEKMLGLKLEPVKRPMDVLVIDSYSKTSFEN